MATKNYTIVSLFAGCGGLDLGFKGDFKSLNKHYPKNNFEIAWANEIDKYFCQTYKTYFKHDIVCADIRDVLWEPKDKLSNTITPLPEKADIVLGGFPCQDFSHAGKRRGFTNMSGRGLLYKSMMETVKRTQPALFVAENVKGLLSMKTENGDKAVDIIMDDFGSLGYHISMKLYLSADYGVPQMRERVIIVGTRKDILPKFEHTIPKLDKSEWMPLRKAIGDLENVPEGELPNHYWSKAKRFPGTQGNNLVSPDKPGPTMRAEHHGNIEFHWNGTRRLSAREAARIQSFPDDFIFYPSTSNAYKQIGNAVPPVMAWHIARSIQTFLDKHMVKKTTKKVSNDSVNILPQKPLLASTVEDYQI